MVPAKHLLNNIDMEKLYVGWEEEDLLDISGGGEITTKKMQNTVL